MKRKIFILAISSMLIGLIAGLIYLQQIYFETPLICFDLLHPIENWKENPQDRYCIMRRVVTNQELKGLTENQVIELLGEPTREDPKDNGGKSVHYVTKHGFLIDWYFLGLSYNDGKVDKMWEELD